MKKKIRGMIVWVKVEDVSPNDWNPNEMSETLQEKEEKSFERFGFVKAPIVYEPFAGKYTIIDGEHRYKLLKKGGAKVIPVRNLGNIPESEAKALTVVLNELKGSLDFFKLTDLLANFDDLIPSSITEVTPFSIEEIENFRVMAEFNPSDYGFDPESYTDAVVRDWIQIPCRVKTEEMESLEVNILNKLAKLGINSGGTVPRNTGLMLAHLLRDYLREQDE